MIVNFYLLGSFEAQIGAGNRIPLGDALAAKILAFLAFRNRFCSRDEIVAACWGSHKLAGREKLDDEAYQKQIYKAREIFTDILGLPWRDYFHSQPNGAQLKDGTYTTDISQFDEFHKIGTDIALSDAVRLDALQKAESLRRGYLLDGMHCEWIVSQIGGARSDYAAKVQTIQREIKQLQAVTDAVGPNRVPFCNGFYDVIPILRKTVGRASSEIIFYGINFHVTVPVILDLLLERLQAGVRIKFLLLDPHGHWLKELAVATCDEELTLKAECMLSIRRLLALSRQLSGDTQEAPLLEVAVFDGMIPGRIYAIDPETTNGQLFYFPYMNGVSPTRLPGYLWPRKSDTPYVLYHSELRRLWNDQSNRRVFRVSDFGELD